MPDPTAAAPPYQSKHSFGFTLSTREFNQFKDFIYNHFGINLTDNKRALFMGRIQKIMKERGFKKVSEYYQFIRSNVDPTAVSELVDKISTNHTYFYRES